MPLLETLLVMLGPSVAKALLKVWLADREVAASAGQSVIDLVGAQLSGIVDRRKAKRQVEDIADKIVEQLEPLFENENFGAGGKELVAREVSVTLDDVVINSELVARNNLNAGRLAQYLLESRPDAVRDMSEPQHQLYDKVIESLSSYLVRLSFDLPATLAEVLSRVDEIPTILQKTIEEHERTREQSQQHNKTEAAKRFEERYRTAVKNRLDRVQLFGLDNLGTHSKQYRLSMAYVPLKVAGTELQEITDVNGNRVRIQPDNISINDMLSKNQKLVVRGQAGLGKTTLLSWLSTQAATGSFGDDLAILNQTVPLYVRLREFFEKPLPQPQDFPALVAPEIADTMPTGWVHKQLNNGRGMILVDGLDELPEAQREDVRGWIDGLSVIYPNNRYLVTSRPTALEEGWLSAEGFTTVELKPMDREEISSCIDKWHDAVGELIGDAEKLKELEQKRSSLLSQVMSSDALLDLSSRPLLCAAICALNWDKYQIPNNIVDLYDDLIKMLLGARDEQRRLIFGSDYPSLDLSDRRMLLSEIAFYMMTNGWSTIQQSDLKDFLKTKLQNRLRLDETDAEKACNLLIDRTGTLQEPTAESAEFTHRSLQEFLTAEIVSRDGHTGVLRQHADDDRWHETIVFTAGIAAKYNKNVHRKLVNELLEEVDEQNKAKSKRTLALLALTCWVEGGERDSELQQRLVTMLSVVCPLEDFDEAQKVATLKDAAVPYLVCMGRSFSDQIHAYALSLIGTEAAIAQLKTFDIEENMELASFIYELAVFSYARLFDDVLLPGQPKAITVGSYSDMNQVARLKSVEVLAFNPYVPHIAAISEKDFSLQPLIDLPSLKTLNFFGLPPRNHVLETFPDLPNLESFTLSQPSTELELSTVFSKVPNVKSLKLRGTDEVEETQFLNLVNKEIRNLTLTNFPKVHSLNVLANYSLESLSLQNFLSITSLDVLKSQSNLRSLVLSEIPKIVELNFLQYLSLNELLLDSLDNINELPSLDQIQSLKKLTLRRCLSLKNVSALHEGNSLEMLELSDLPLIDDLSFIKNQRELRVLVLSNLKNVHSLDALSGLTNLSQLSYRDVGATPEQLLEVINYLPNLKSVSLMAKERVAIKSRVKEHIKILDNSAHGPPLIFRTTVD